MGCYVNVPGMTKEQWLKDNGEQVKLEDISWMREEIFHEAEIYPVVVVFMATHSAAAVGFNAQELKELLGPNDKRPKVYFIVAKEKLLGVSSLASYLGGK